MIVKQCGKSQKHSEGGDLHCEREDEEDWRDVSVITCACCCWQRTQVLFPAFTWPLRTVCNFTSRELCVHVPLLLAVDVMCQLGQAPSTVPSLTQEMVASPSCRLLRYFITAAEMKPGQALTNLKALPFANRLGSLTLPSLLAHTENLNLGETHDFL